MPADVACERTGFTFDELVAQWGVQTMARRYADGRSETAVLVPDYLTREAQLLADRGEPGEDA